MSPKNSVFRYLPSLLILIIGLSLSYSAYTVVANLMEEQKKVEFETLIANFVTKIQDEINHESSLLNTLASSLAMAPELMAQKNLDKLSKSLVNEHSTLNSIALIRLQPPFNDYGLQYLYTQNASFTLSEQMSSDVFKLLTDPQKPLSHHAAVDSHITNDPGITIFKRVTPLSIDIDSATTLHFLVTHLSPGKAFNTTLAHLLPEWLDLHLYVSQGRQHTPLYQYSPDSEVKEISDPFSVKNPNTVFIPGGINLYGKPLSIMFVPNNNEFFNATPLAFYVLILGCVMSFGLAAYVTTLSRRNATINREVKARTEELNQLNGDLENALHLHETDLEKLRVSENDMRSLVNSVDGVVWEVDFKSQRVNYVSKQVQRILGFTPDEILSKKHGLAELVHPADKELFEGTFQSLAEGEYPQREIRMFNAEEEIVHIRDILTPVIESGHITKVRGVMLDVTKYKKMGQERAKMEVQLRQAQKLEAVGQLAAGIAHEINTPAQFVGDNIRFLNEAFEDLNTLTGYYKDLLAKMEDETERQQAIEQIENHTKTIDLEFLLEDVPEAINQSLDGVSRISTIVKAMKEFSHPGSDTMETIDLNHAIENTVTVARNEWRYVAEIEKDFDENLPMVECLPGEFNQTVLNMIVNASHAIGDKQKAEQTTETGQITIKSYQEDGKACISISDTGCGIPQDKIANIFDPFFTTKEVGKGTGQGLSIAYSVIVDKHQGSIDVESNPGEGTTFILKIPFKQEAVNDAVESQEKALA